MPFFSVIIPTYNRAALLREALDSVLAQTCSDYELIVVDDGSTDDTAGAIAEYGRKVRFFRQGNQGPGAARNLGIANASGEYIAFLDSDDVWFPWTLSTYQGAVHQGSGPAFICGCAADFAGPSISPGDAPPALRITRYPDYLSSSGDPIWIGTCSVAIKAAALREVGGFLAANCNAEDSDLWLKLGSAPGFHRITSPPVFRHRRTPGSAVSSNQKTYLGMANILDSEMEGAYPGGPKRRNARREIISRHVRSASFGLLQTREFRKASYLYRATFGWHCRFLRFKYLLGFPLLLARERARAITRSQRR